MEAIADEPVEDGQVPKTPEEVVAQVLASTKFLRSAGLQPAANKSSKSVYAARVRELEAQLQELQAGKQDAVALQDQVVVLEQKLVELETTRDKDIEALKKHAEETDAILRRLFNVNK
ncbi:hypothetical protein QOZ80_9BG0703300 [Eleusine coracana subsp. coracana]|nr:hypothetical protein QOZ80_9BG0703300 [Eleusine coracana subsp. coracana]